MWINLLHVPLILNKLLVVIIGCVNRIEPPEEINLWENVICPSVKNTLEH